VHLVFFSVNITAEEVRDYLESQGAENVVLIDDVVGFDPWKKGVFASGRSLRHIRKMTEGIHANVSLMTILSRTPCLLPHTWGALHEL